MPTETAALPTAVPSKVARTYAERLASLEAEERQLHTRHLQLGWLRLALAVAFLALLLPPRWFALLPLFAFLVLVRMHALLLQKLTGKRRNIAYLKHALLRIEDRWAGTRPRTVRHSLADHLYATDLDLFGDGSLFELLCETRTTAGEDTLAGWLLTPSATESARERQAAVAELSGNLALREALASAPGPEFATLDRAALVRWADLPPLRVPQSLRLIAPVLVLLTFAAAVRYALVHSPVLLILSLLVDASLTFSFARSYRPLFAQTESASQPLATVAALAALVQQQAFHAPLLQQLQSVLASERGSAPSAIRRLATYARWAEERSNYIVRLVDAPLLYSLQLALAIESWRRRYGPQLGAWLDALGTLEALLSLAAYHYEHPDDVFPEFSTEDTVYAAQALGHPLLPAAQCVRNDLLMGRGTRLLLVSGSNMSGKSTLLRSVGINAVLAFAGAPVRAKSLSLSSFNIAASIHVNDSLQAGRSRFYAEILRLHAITEAARKNAPLLFLIDEVLAGTNSADRLAGAKGLASELLSTGALGMLSTHDLALTGLSVQDSKRIRNAHFEDHITEGKLLFDYRLRPGVLQRSNGVALMRLIGLKV